MEINTYLLLTLIGGYFLLLLGISFLTGKDRSNANFFRANKKSPWFVVAFGMIGASLSGVTFISVPGAVQATQFTYMQVVFGYVLGYAVIAFVLLPLYYRLNLTSIYEYLSDRYGRNTHKTGAFFFLISRVIGASFRLYLVALVLQYFVFDALGVPFELTVILSVTLIYLYTFRSGLRTIVWTDTLQTLCMLLALGAVLYQLGGALGKQPLALWTGGELAEYTKLWVTDSPLERSYWLKSVLGGMFISICMTGLDQDMMQKNLSCRNVKESQWNMISFSLTLLVVNLAFLLLGAMLFKYASLEGIGVPRVDGEIKTDLLFPEIALNQGLGDWVTVVFMLGLLAAAYSSADSALTSLTTSFYVDILGMKERQDDKAIRVRSRIHLAMGAVLILVITSFRYLLGTTVIDGVLTIAGYTYGPLLGLYAFGYFTRHTVSDKKTLWICLSAVGLIALLDFLPRESLGGYDLGYELLLINGALTFLGLFLLRKRK
jgi:Na+/proline symporter